MKKAKPKKKPRRVVLGVGHPWFNRSLSQWTSVSLTKASAPPFDWVGLQFGDLGNYNKIRLVAEVLK